MPLRVACRRWTQRRTCLEVCEELAPHNALQQQVHTLCILEGGDQVDKEGEVALHHDLGLPLHMILQVSPPLFDTVGFG